VKQEEKRLLARPKPRWLLNIKMDFGEIGLGRGLNELIWVRIGTGEELL
jgi:hypothetical protein